MNSAVSSATKSGTQFEVDALARLSAENPMADKNHSATRSVLSRRTGPTASYQRF